MNKLKILLFIFLFIEINSIAQNEQFDIIKSRANLYAKAIKKYDFKETIKFTYPKLVNILGGKDSVSVIYSDKMVKLKQEGLRYKSFDFGNPQEIYKHDNFNYCFIRQKIVQANSQGEVKTDSYLLAVYDDEEWYFITEEQFLKYKKLIFGELSNKIIFPKSSKVFIRYKSFSAFNKPK